MISKILFRFAARTRIWLVRGWDWGGGLEGKRDREKDQ